MRQSKSRGYKKVKEHKLDLLTRTNLYLFLICISIFVFSIGSFYYFQVLAISKQRDAEFSRQTVKMYSHYIDSRLNQIKDFLNRIAVSPGINSLIETKDVAAIAQEEDYLSSLFPRDAHLRLYYDIPVSVDRNAKPPIGFGALKMLRQASNNGHPAPEVHRIGKNEELLSFSMPIHRDGSDQVSGVLFLSMKATWLQDILASLGHAPGGIQLRQAYEDAFPLSLALSGDFRTETASSIKTLINNNNWQLDFRLEPNKFISKDTVTRIFFITLTFSLLFITLFFFLSNRLLSRLIVEDLAQFMTALPRLQREGAAFHMPEFKFFAFSDMVTQLSSEGGQKILARLDGKGAAQRLAAAAKAKSTEKSAAGKNDFNDDVGLEDDLDSQYQVAPTTIEVQEFDDDAEVADSIFRAYDIRGVVGDTLTIQGVSLLGRAVGSVALDAGDESIVVGRDGRKSGPEVMDAFIQGLQATGINVIDISQVPTPVVYYAIQHLETNAGVSITASHNPPQYNGMKIVIGGKTLAREGIRELHQRIIDKHFIDGASALKHVDVMDSYINEVVHSVSLKRPLKVVIDGGNSVAGPVAQKLMAALGCECVPLFCEVDGNFPNHHPDPSNPKNLTALMMAMRDSGADIGLAYDGDGDRLGVVTPRGKIIWPDRQLILYAQHVLLDNPGGQVIFDVKCSRHVEQSIQVAGGKPTMWRTGHSFIKEKMRETNAILGGEMSGHFFFADRWFGFDDAFYASARLLEILSGSTESADQIFARIPESVSTPEIQVPISDDEKLEIIDRLVSEHQFKNARINTIDGLRADFESGWGLVRASNTTPCLVLRFEAETEADLDSIKEQFRDLLRRINPSLELNF